MGRPVKTRSFWTLLIPYDAYERHAVVSHLLLEAIADHQEDTCVLDVGGRAELLEQFTAYPVVSINIDGSGDLLGSGCALPLVDNSFSAVVSIDTLEHLPRWSRLSFLRECLRVTRRYVVVAAPLGSEGHTQCEKRLDELHRSICGQPHPYLREHIQYGLPDLAEIGQLVQQLGLADFQCLFAGDYVWQGKRFERAVLGHQGRGLVRRLRNAYNYVTSLALFHHVQLRDQPGATTNRFYLMLEKRAKVAQHDSIVSTGLQALRS